MKFPRTLPLLALTMAVWWAKAAHPSSNETEPSRYTSPAELFHLSPPSTEGFKEHGLLTSLVKFSKPNYYGRVEVQKLKWVRRTLEELSNVLFERSRKYKEIRKRVEEKRGWVRIEYTSLGWATDSAYRTYGRLLRSEGDNETVYVVRAIVPESEWKAIGEEMMKSVDSFTLEKWEPACERDHTFGH